MTDNSDIAKVIPIGAGAGSHLATVSLWRKPDGTIAARLEDMPVHVIEDRDTIARRLLDTAGWCLGASQSFLHQAAQFDSESQEGRA
jgi:hypothetical protein